MNGDERGFGPRRTFAPVTVGEELDVKIEAVGEKGDGVAKVKGFVLFVPSTKEGDEVRVKITRVLRKVGFAEVLGQASGPVQADQPPKKKPKDEEASEESDETEEETQEDSGDSENFGEEQ